MGSKNSKPYLSAIPGDITHDRTDTLCFDIKNLDIDLQKVIITYDDYDHFEFKVNSGGATVCEDVIKYKITRIFDISDDPILITLTLIGIKDFETEEYIFRYTEDEICRSLLDGMLLA